MENPKPIGQVFRTKDYSIFKTHELNRNIREGLLRKLRKSMLRIGWLQGSEILVFPNMKVIDGHHRLIVAQELKIPVEYRVVNSRDNNLIVEHNKNKESWSFMDNITTQVKLGNQNYVLLDRFMKNFPDLRPTECIMLVRNTLSSSNREEIESGCLKLGDLKKGYEWGHNIMNIKPFFPQYYNKSIFVRAMVKSLSNTDFQIEEFMKKLKLRPTSLKPCGTVDQYVQMIQEIYNYRRNTDEKIRLV